MTWLLQLLALQPGRPAPVQRLELRPDRPGHAELDGLAVTRLQIGEVAIAFRKAREQLLVELDLGGRVDRRHQIALVDRLAQHQAPAPAAFLQEIIEAAGAHHAANDALHPGAAGALAPWP